MKHLGEYIPVTIFYDSKSVTCEGSCGIDWTSTETIDTLRKRIEERFGDSVKMEIIDVSLNDKILSTLTNRIKIGNLLFPLLMVNNELRISGEFDTRQLIDAVEVEKEINSVSPSLKKIKGSANGK